MLIPGPKLNTLFRSRWNALLWGAGVLLTAYCSIPSREESKAEADAAAASKVAATSPWAREPTPAAPAQ
ncbi:hypothetical protein [Novosphingobium sp.]|uniref:hypothetical protein n=1 Tax=Novosphingobium sp. TaxID=1874826 RepID=UPI00333FD366